MTITPEDIAYLRNYFNPYSAPIEAVMSVIGGVIDDRAEAYGYSVRAREEHSKWVRDLAASGNTGWVTAYCDALRVLEARSKL